ncbi:MAG: LUD domain-containing protein [Tissierellia bacterium]|nr:LUD domain-containing protein [Tissierellia bacterium]
MSDFIIDETDLIDEEKMFFNTQVSILKKKFGGRRIDVHGIQNVSELYSFIDSFIEERSYVNKISFSDSVTLYQLDVFNYILENYAKEKEVFWPLERSKSGHYKIYGEQPKGRMNLPYDEYIEKHTKWYEHIRKAQNSDLTIISANAITMNGEIVSVDGLGNRVSSMIFGPKHVLIIVGKNKIVKNIESAIERIHNYTAPLTYIRHANKHYTNHMKLPCVQTGKCISCSSPESACMNTVIIRGQIHHHADRIHLIIINENLGF